MTSLTSDVRDAPANEAGEAGKPVSDRVPVEAKAAYAKLIKTFPNHVLAKRAQGCLDRLSLEGSVLNLAAPTALVVDASSSGTAPAPLSI